MEHSKGSPDKGTVFSETQFLQCGTKRLNLSTAVVMGILNITPDSFYDGGKHKSMSDLLSHAGKMIEEGASIIDIGAVSTRPGSTPVSPEEEKSRIFPVVEAILANFPEVVVSVDTYRAAIALECCNMGAGIINDISGGQADAEMFEIMGKQKAAYVLMHMQGTPQTMQLNPSYSNVTVDIADFFAEQLVKPGLHGKKNIILDPGFGFGKTTEDNYTLLNYLDAFLSFGLPLLVGVSRKSMINKVLNTSPEQALNGTTVLNTIALMKGASILRVHDVKEAVETIKLVNSMRESGLNA
ncbi:MAG: dihydropteroate synthase [Lentimicrobium sp.]|nr:dihydropteroate synthase [Lentimicrobium sp.]